MLNNSCGHIFFFFSSRRRHTRLVSDWSSDVCSSDLLEDTIEVSEGLIRTFDALLMIARAESGEVREGMAEFDVAEVARDVSELYEPLEIGRASCRERV